MTKTLSPAHRTLRAHVRNFLLTATEPELRRELANDLERGETVRALFVKEILAEAVEENNDSEAALKGSLDYALENVREAAVKAEAASLGQGRDVVAMKRLYRDLHSLLAEAAVAANEYHRFLEKRYSGN